MSPDEVIEKLKTLDITITRPTLLRYEADGLIPAPKRGALGRGGGRWTDYPEESVPEAYAAWTMMHGSYGFKLTNEELFDGKPPKFSPALIAFARKIYYSQRQTDEQKMEEEKKQDEQLKKAFNKELEELQANIKRFGEKEALKMSMPEEESGEASVFIMEAKKHLFNIFWGYRDFVSATWEWERDQAEAILTQRFVNNNYDSRKFVLHVKEGIKRKNNSFLNPTSGIKIEKFKPE